MNFLKGITNLIKDPCKKYFSMNVFTYVDNNTQASLNLKEFFEGKSREFAEKKSSNPSMNIERFYSDEIKKKINSFKDNETKESFVEYLIYNDVLVNLEVTDNNGNFKIDINKDFMKCFENIDVTKEGGAPSKVTIKGKQCTVYVKVNGEFMTVKQAQKLLKPKSKPSASPRGTVSKSGSPKRK